MSCSKKESGSSESNPSKVNISKTDIRTNRTERVEELKIINFNL